MDRLSLLQSMLEEEPDSSFLKYGIALEYHKVGKKKLAVNGLLEIQKEDPEYIGVYYTLAKWFQEEEEVDSAIETCEKGIEIALKLNDQKALSELKSLKKDVEDEDDW